MAQGFVSSKKEDQPVTGKLAIKNLWLELLFEKSRSFQELSFLKNSIS